MKAQEKLFELATAYHFFRVASFVSADISAAMKMGLIGQTDLLALNLDEAAAVVGLSPEDTPLLTIVQAAVKKLRTLNPGMLISVTAGKEGSWSWDGKRLGHVPAFKRR